MKTERKEETLAKEERRKIEGRKRQEGVGLDLYVCSLVSYLPFSRFLSFYFFHLPKCLLSLSLFSLSFAPPSSFSFSSYQFIFLSSLSISFFSLFLLPSFLCPTTNVTNLNPSLLQVPECGSESEPKTGFFIQSLIPVSLSLSLFLHSLPLFRCNSHFLLLFFSILLSISFLTFLIFSLLTLLVFSHTFILHPPLLSRSTLG